MKFPYIKIPTSDPHRKWISRPIITAMITGPKGSVIVDALIDSGADKCLFHSDLAREIGLYLQDGKQEVFSGITGKKIIAFNHKIHLQVLGIDRKIELVVAFTNAPGVFAILGQEGFFDNFRIKFEKDHNTIEVTPIRKKK